MIIYHSKAHLKIYLIVRVVQMETLLRHLVKIKMRSKTRRLKDLKNHLKMNINLFLVKVINCVR
jgi:hypothetical protein